MKTIFLFFLVLGFSFALPAQQAAPDATVPPLPPGPLIQKRAPDFAQWAIRIVNDSAPEKSGVQTPDKKIDKEAAWGAIIMTTKTGKILLRQTYDDRKRIWNTWCIGDLNVQTTLSPDGKNWVVQTPNADPHVHTPNYVDYSKSDFPDFAWISKNNYAGIKEMGGKKCIVFTASIKMNSDDPMPTLLAAYIDLDTRYPVAFIQGGEFHSYEFKQPPKDTLPLPQLVQDLLNNRKKMAESAVVKPARSY